MGTRKKTTELIFYLQWRNKLDNGGDKSNVIGMYDTPTTTSNFDMFKSYLLKNSGVAGNDVKVTYLTDDGQEWVIDSQEWFEIALSAFRLKARLGEIIYLKLDKISSARHQMMRKHSNDAETQFDSDSIDNSPIAPPEWFTAYMKQFKRDVVEEVTVAVSSNLIANSKDKETVIPPIATTSKKVKPEASKRSRKHLVLGETPIDKELLKTFKFDRKLENKLDKLDAKTKKIKEKKQALINRIESDEHRYVGKFSFIDDDDLEKRHHERKPILITKFDGNKTDVKNSETNVDMNASLVNSSNNGVYEHLLGGEIYLHTWEVLNSGKLPWTPYTELRLTWGSSELIPSVKSIRCPCLKPTEKGTISIRFEIPRKPGTYESYWNFYDRNIRFGNSLSCCVIVEEPLASIIHDECCKSPSPKLMLSPKEIKEKLRPFCYPPSCNNIHVEDADKQIRKVIRPVDERSLFMVPTTSGDTEKVMCLTHGLEATIESPSKIEDDKKHVKEEIAPNNLQKILIFPDGVAEQSTAVEMPVNVKNETRQTENGSHNISGPPFDYSQLQNLTSEQMERVRKLYESAIDVTRLEVGCDEPVQTNKVDVSGSSNLVMDLSQRIEDMKIAVDSDSEWESVWSFGKSKNMEENLTVDGKIPATNKYGINEKDLIVDLSKNSKENSIAEKPVEKVTAKEETNTNGSQDNNNNNGTVDNNNSSGESISEIASDGSSSDLSSGYDVLCVPVCDEKEDDGSGYVYITIDGNKLPVPKHILRPDFLVNAEEAPGPLNSIEYEKPIETKDLQKENVPVESSSTEKTTVKVSVLDPNRDNREENTLDMSHCSAACSSFSDVNSGRLFIFPQNNPGYEVVSSTNIENQQTSSNELPSNDISHIYTWAKSDTNYSLEDLQNSCVINPVNLKTDPYGPLDQSGPSARAPTTPTSSAEHHPSPRPEHPKVQFCCSNPVMFPHPPCSYAPAPAPPGAIPPYGDCARTSPYPHIPNFQQSVPKPCDLPPFSAQEGPTAPPQQPKVPEESPAHGVPVHILPENLVSGAVNVASSAINTARSVINMIVPPKSEPGRWVNGHWVTEIPESIRAKNLCILAEMGFWDADLNATLLARYNDDIVRVVSELIQ